jgi:hypothetical protein
MWSIEYLHHKTRPGATKLEENDKVVTLTPAWSRVAPRLLESVALDRISWDLLVGGIVMVLGVSGEESARIARLLNCKEGVLPMKYLDIPVSNMKLYSTDLIYVGVKVEKRLPSWQGLHLSSGGKSILMESNMSSLPMYTMRMYLLLEEVHHKIDSARVWFY